MADKTLKLENANLSNFDPSMIDKGQEMIFTLRDTNVLDNDNNNNANINPNFNDNYQIDEVKYKDTGIMIERYNENELMNNNKEKNYIEIQDNGVIDENSLLNKFKNIKNKIEKKNQNIPEKIKFQEEFYNPEELKLLNKKKNRKKKTSMILFDIDMNEEENKEDKKDKEDKNDNINDINDNINDIKIDETKNNDFNTLNNHKKSLFTSEDKEKLESMFNSKKNNKEIKVKKNVINIDENLLEENDDNNDKDNNNNDNIRINKNKNYKVLDDYAIFLDNLPKPKNIEESNEKDESITNTELNNHNEDNDNKIEDKKEKEKEENKAKEDKEEENADDEYTFKQDDEIPLISDEPIIGKGVCVALQIFKNKKMLRKEEEFGRYHDKKYENITNGINEENVTEYDNNTLNIKDKDEYYKHKEINIEYRDENGKKLRPKEMARYQALIFHGSQSSVRKREKKLLREKYQVFVQNPTNNKTLNYMNYMKEKNHQAFATLQGKSSFL